MAPGYQRWPDGMWTLGASPGAWSSPGRGGWWGLAHPGEDQALELGRAPQPQARKDTGRQNAGGRQSRGQRWGN